MSSASVKKGLPRPVEVTIALVGLILTSPLLLFCAVAIALTDSGPVLFRQQRVGRNGCLFVLYKLRSMRLGAAGIEITASHDARVTAIGKILRKTKLDEVPELWNVIRGDMALVGPRPEVPRYIDMSNEQWRLTLAARPGITDPMTLRLRNEEALLAAVKDERENFYLTTLQPFKLQGYLEYLSQRSWWTDIKVILNTCIVVIAPSQAPLEMMKEVLLLQKSALSGRQETASLKSVD